MPDKYFLRARLWPTVLTSIPVMAIYWYFIKPTLGTQLNEIPYLPLLSNVSFSAAIVFLLIQINRFLAKEIFQSFYFKDEQEMPTTNYLLWKDNFFTPQAKKLIRDKIKESFSIELCDEALEKSDESNARKQICLAVSQIRELIRGNEMLLRHNIEYGFFRNFLGGCVVAVFSSIVGAYLSYLYGLQTRVFFFFIVMAVAYFIPIVFSSLLVKKYGRYYAKILYEQFLSHKIINQ